LKGLVRTLDTRKSYLDADPSGSSREMSGTSQSSYHTTLRSSTSTKRGSHSQRSQSRASADSSAATSWSSNHELGPRDPWTNAHTGFGAAQFTPINGNVAYTHEGGDSRLLHIGAHFHDVVDGGTRTVISTPEWHMDPRYQSPGQPVAYNMAPMERFQQQTLGEEPYGYGYMNVEGESSVHE
jgi:hypothetical protein